MCLLYYICAQTSVVPPRTIQVDYLWLLMRSLSRRHLEASSNSITDDNMTFTDMLNLCSNSNGFSAEKKLEFRRGARLLAEFQEQLPRVAGYKRMSEDELYELVCKEECNSFVGEGMSLAFSMH